MLGWVKNFPLLMNRVGMAPIAKSVLKYINVTSIAYLHCLLRFSSGLVLLVPELVGCMGWIGSHTKVTRLQYPQDVIHSKHFLKKISWELAAR